MAKRDELLALAVRCESANKADREIDIAIKAAIYGGVALVSPFNGEWCLYRLGTIDPRTGKALDRPHSVSHPAWIQDKYTASLDAAMSLVPDGFLHYVWYPESGGIKVQICDQRRQYAGFGVDVPEATSSSYSLALTAAALRARAAAEE